MPSLLKQLTYSFRVLRKSPGFTLSALTILTLGIGANTAIFGIVDAVLLRPLPFPHANRIVTVQHVPPQTAFPGVKTFSVSAANFVDWRKQSDVFQAMSVGGGRNFSLGGGTRPQAVLATIVDDEFFSVVQVNPAAGRAFTAEECQPGRDNVIVLSDGFAKSLFGSPKGALGKQMELNKRTYFVIGVMPPEFQLRSWFPASTQAWVPLAWKPEDRTVRGNHNYSVIARLKDGVTVQQAQLQMNAISDRLARDYPEEDKGWGAVVTSLNDSLVGNVRPALLTLLGAVGFVLLIACANTANLVLARTINRRKELAIRSALGASAGQVRAAVLIETTLLAVVGGVLGLLFAQWAQTLVIAALADQMPRATNIELNPRVLGFTLLASVLTGIFAGLIASWRLLRADLNETLKQGLGKTDAAASGRHTRSVLVVAEVALSLMLLVGAGLMIRSLWALRNVAPGFNPANVATMTVPVNRFYDDFLPQVRALPGVVAVGATDTLPLTGGGSHQPIAVEGRPAEVFALQPNVSVRYATPDFIRAMGIPLVAGRDLELADASGTKAVALISQAMAKQFWPGENPVGKRFRISFEPEIVREVVGVVGDVKERGLDVLDPVSMLYQPLPKNARGNMSLVVRTAKQPSAIVSAITAIAQKNTPEAPVRDVITMEQVVADSLSQHRFSMYLFIALAVLAWLLAAVGIYSVIAYTVRGRVQEISVRMVLGAQARDVLRLVVVQGMKPALMGVAVGAVGAYVLGGLLSQLIFGVSPSDPYTFAAVAFLLTAVAFFACVIPAWRATRLDPVSALRDE